MCDYSVYVIKIIWEQMCVLFIFSDPTYFSIYASVSFAGVVLAAIFYGLLIFGRKRTFSTINNTDDIEDIESNSDASSSTATTKSTKEDACSISGTSV